MSGEKLWKKPRLVKGCRADREEEEEEEEKKKKKKKKEKITIL